VPTADIKKPELLHCLWGRLLQPALRWLWRRLLQPALLWGQQLQSARLRRWLWDGFAKGRDFAAWLGLVPKQFSTGDRTVLGKISKRGNRYLRVLFVQAAWVVLIRPKSWERYGLKPWIEAAKRRLHHNVLAIALANKLARIAWSVLAHGRSFEASKFAEGATQPA
jgi:Transposase IS116/IS110/IS902 family